MLAVSAMVAVVAMILFALGQSVVAAVLLTVAFGLVFSGISELSKERSAYSVVTNPTQNNIFFGHPMVDDILHMIEDTGCCESISFENETSLCCTRRAFSRGDSGEASYPFTMGGRKVSLTLEEQYDLLNLLKYHLPNGESYHIQAAYDKQEYEALQRSVVRSRFYADGMRNPHYATEVLPSQPKYYVMTTEAYRGMRFNKERKRWERPISVYTHAENEKAV